MGDDAADGRGDRPPGPSLEGFARDTDGQRFLAVSVGGEVEGSATQEIYIVTDWFEELRRRMGSN